MLYFDNAATAHWRPESVYNAVHHAMKNFGNPSRAAHKNSLTADRTISNCRLALHHMFQNTSPEKVIFTNNATTALNIAIQTLEGHIITTEAEHNSVLRPIYKKNNYSILPCDHNGALNFDMLSSYLKADTCAIVMSHASNVTGTVYNLKEVGLFCKKNNLKLIVDGAQTAGLLPINMKENHIAALCITGHKSLLGPQGTGALLLNDDFSPFPIVVGGSGSHSFQKEMPAFYPTYLEAGTQNAHGIAGLLAGIKYIEINTLDKLYTKALELTYYFYNNIVDIEGITIYGDFSHKKRMPIVSLNLNSLDASEIAFLLDKDYHIATRAGIHCAPLIHHALQTAEQGSVRFSFSHQNTFAEIDLAVHALKEILSSKNI
jgi:cysteine desulfurase family protein